MTTATAKALSAQEVKISQTTYQVIDVQPATSESVFSIVIQTKNTIKNLSLVSGDWFLSSGRRGVPKFVSPEFIRHEVIAEFTA